MAEPTNDERNQFLPFDLNTITEEMIEKAEQELGETEEVRKKSLIKMKKQIKEDPRIHIPMEDYYLLFYLRNRKFNVSKAMIQLMTTLNTKMNFKTLFEPDIENFKEVIRRKILYVLPYRDQDGSAIMVLRIGNWIPDELKFEYVLRSVANLAFACLDFHVATQICGFKIIVDVKGVGFKYISCISPKYVKLLVLATTNALPLRIGAIHFLNESVILQYLWSIMKFWMSEKMKKRVYFHGADTESLKTHFHSSILPEEFGGNIKHNNYEFLKKLDETKERYYALWNVSYKSKGNI